MSNREAINDEYKQNLEESIISYLAEVKNIEVREAMDIYYNSRLSEQIAEGKYDIDNMDYKYLTLDLIENEQALFSQYKPEVLEAMEEAKRLSRDPLIKGYTNIDDVIKELES